MSLTPRLVVLAAIAFLLWALWPVLRRLLCGHDGLWETTETVAGFGVPVREQRCVRCGQLRNIGGAVVRREVAR